MFAAEFGTGQVLWSLVWTTVFVVWIMLLFQVIRDVFRSRDMSGAVKAAWLIFVVVLPYVGVFAYLVIRGDDLSYNLQLAAEQEDAAADAYVSSTVGRTRSTSEEISRLAGLRESGLIDEAEYSAAKSNLLRSI